MPVEDTQLDERLKSLRIDRDRGSASSGGDTPRTPKMLLLGISALIVLVLFATYFLFFRGAKTVQVAEVGTEAGSGASAGDTVLTVSGYVVAAHRIDVGAKVLGRVQWIGVDKGDKVAAGQVLVRLEDADYRAQVEQARAALAAAEARLDELRAGSRPQEKERDRAAIAQAEANLQNAELEFERTQKLFDSGVAAKAELDRVRSARDVARAQLESARQSSSLTDVGPRIEQIRAAEAAVAQARGTLDYAETQLENTKIVSPVNGTILQRIVEVGEMVSPSAFGGDSGTRTSVVSLADLTDLQVELDISQTDFAKLKMGQRAEIVPEAYPNLKYTGAIGEIAPEANRAKATVQVKVQVEAPDEQLRPEMSARVNFLADAAPKAQAEQPSVSRAIVPAGAVVRSGDAAFVFVVKGDRVEQRTVRLGDQSGDGFFVLDGLSGGERVVTTGADTLSDGDRVKISG
jgi:HlyD family secretion protein